MLGNDSNGRNDNNLHFSWLNVRTISFYKIRISILGFLRYSRCFRSLINKGIAVFRNLLHILKNKVQVI